MILTFKTNCEVRIVSVFKCLLWYFEETRFIYSQVNWLPWLLISPSVPVLCILSYSTLIFNFQIGNFRRTLFKQLKGRTCASLKENWKYKILYWSEVVVFHTHVNLSVMSLCRTSSGLEPVLLFWYIQTKEIVIEKLLQVLLKKLFSFATWENCRSKVVRLP